MRAAEKLGSDLRHFATVLQYYDAAVKDADLKREERVRAGEDPRVAAMKMGEELAVWDRPYSGVTPQCVLDELSQDLAARAGGTVREAYELVTVTRPRLADLAEMWTRCPTRVLDALRRLGPARWDSIDLTNAEQVAELVVDEVLAMKRAEDARAEAHYMSRGLL